MAEMKISITRALVLKKNISARITRGIVAINSVAVVVGNGVPAGFKTREDYIAHVKARFQSIDDLFTRRQKLTEAIVASNAKTEVTIGDEKLTVAEAIERKNFYKNVRLPFIETLKSELGKGLSLHDREQKTQQDKLEAAVKAFTSRDKSVNSDLEKVRALYADDYSVHFLDPLDLVKTLPEMEDKVTKFLENVDIVLTESNSKTEISIDDSDTE